MKALDPFEVWFVTGSQEMYGDAVLRRVDEHSREVAAVARRGGGRSRSGSCTRR